MHPFSACGRQEWDAFWSVALAHRYRHIAHVEGARRARPCRCGNKRGKTDNRMDRNRGDQNTGERGKQHQRHDTRFEERDVVGSPRDRMDSVRLLRRRGAAGPDI